MIPVKWITAFLYAAFLLGLALCFWDSFASLHYRARSRARLKSLGISSADDSAIKPFAAMLELSLGLKGENAVTVFILASAIPAMAAFVLLYVSFGPAMAVYGMAAAGLTPYIIMRSRLQNKQVDMSREGEQLLTELLNNYRIYHYNMREAIEKTALSIEDAPLSKKMLLDLSRELNEAASVQSQRAAIEKFRMALSTSWGDLLAANMEFAEIDGIMVTESLRDLVENITDARRKLEQTKRETNDSGMVLKFLFPVMCLMIYFGATAAFGMSPQEFIRCQFRTATGMGWFIGLLFSYVVSLLVSSFVSRRKMDI